MAKKIFDIVPPKKVLKKETITKSLPTEEKKYTKPHEYKKYNKKKEVTPAEETLLYEEKHFPLRGVLAGSAILVLIIGGILYFKLQKVDIKIWPKTEVLSFNEQALADNSVDTIDLNGKTIPAEFFEEEKDLWQEFPATGNASNDGRAEGTITIYNKYSPASALTLKSGTHFLSDSGKYFVTLQKVVVPAATKQGSKTVPGSVTVKVQAAEAGEDYNIKSSKFSVPGLSGTSYYYSIYAESSKDMTGGFSSEVKKVTEEDIQNAKDILQKNILESVKELLKNKIGADYILLDNAISAEITESSSAVKAGSVIDKFSYQAKAKAKALAFKKSDLENLIEEYVNSNISSPKTFLEDSLNYNYSSSTVDLVNGKVVLDLSFDVETFKSVDENDLISLFREKSSDQIKEIINSRMGDQVLQAQVNLWPFWTTKAPKDKTKIKVELKF